MENVSVESAKGWRDIASYNLAGVYKILDPCRRIHNFQAKEFKRVFELDLRDINESDVILVNLCDPAIAKHGTAMEVFYANYVLRKPVVAFKDDPSVKHPFFEQLVTTWVSNIHDACEILQNEYL